MSQVERVLEFLTVADLEGVCASQFYRNALPNARNRIVELKARGYHIVSEPCPDKHGPSFFRYWLLHGPERKCIDCYQLRLGVA